MTPMSSQLWFQVNRFLVEMLTGTEPILYWSKSTIRDSDTGSCLLDLYFLQAFCNMDFAENWWSMAFSGLVIGLVIFSLINLPIFFLTEISEVSKFPSQFTKTCDL